MMGSLTTPRGEIVIREANPADAIQFRELRLGALQDSPIAFTADYHKNLNHPLKYWEDMLTVQADESTIFLAEHKRSTTVPRAFPGTARQGRCGGSPVDESNLIGMTGIARGGSPKTRHSAWIWGVYVKPEWRGLHIAEELITSCFTWAKARKIILAKLGVAAINQPAIRCYERCGFKTYGIEPRVVFYDGKYYDEYLMVHSLDNP